MALFHFRIKSDKKPDGSKISAVNHVDYIRREGAFSDVDRSTSIDRFSGNFISSAEIKDAYCGLDSFLYRTDDFGCIKNSPDGIEVSENSSPTTISIALLLADKVMNHQPLIISGSDDFKKSVINAAISDDLPVSFADPDIQNLFIHLKELIENERNSFISNGGSLVTNRLNPSHLLRLLIDNQSNLLPKSDFACLHCPNSLWFIQNHKELTCFCRLMNLVSWNNSQKTSITMCDGTFLSNEKN